jgi:regulatory protein
MAGRSSGSASPGSSHEDDEFETMAPRLRHNVARGPTDSDGAASEVLGAGQPVSEFTRTSERPAKALKSSKGRKILSLRARAVGLLSRREHSRLELERKLGSHADDPDALRMLLDALEKEGWLNNARYATSLMHRRAPVRGTIRIVSELRQSGVDGDQIAALRDTLRSTEYERGLAVWKKRFGGDVPVDRAVYAKQARFLAGRGFANDVIRTILGSLDIE